MGRVAAGVKRVLELADRRHSVNDAVYLVREFISPNTREISHAQEYLSAPWPQPSPHAPGRIAPAVLHVPQPEIKVFLDTIVARYIHTLRWGWPDALRTVIAEPNAELPSDAEFMAVFTETALGQEICPGLDERDQEDFAQVLKSSVNGSDRDYYKIDTHHVDRFVPVRPDLYCCPTVTLLEKVDGCFTPRAIRCGSHVFTPTDGDAWSLAKLYAIQGAVLRFVLSWHPRVHFPSDTVVAVSKTVLPEGHLLHDLLMPHFYMQLPLNFAVLYVNKSVAQNRQREPYTPFLHVPESLFEFVSADYEGVDGNRAFPAYRFWEETPDGCTDYSTFIRGLYDVVLEYVAAVLTDELDGDDAVAAWAGQIAEHLPGFPGSDEIFEGDTLHRTVAAVITNCGIIHSADHCSYARIPIHRGPLRLRVPPPEPGLKLTGRERFVNHEDVFRHALAKRMYFEPTTLKRMVDLHEQFRGHRIEPHARRFTEAFRDKYWEMGIVKYIPLEEIATSVQY
ncbi:MAG: hypothetical protein KC502_13675 [Myxococcales bacterium]|nr:hypothetical protein [Myxococcales bacterium]